MLELLTYVQFTSITYNIYRSMSALNIAARKYVQPIFYYYCYYYHYYRIYIAHKFKRARVKLMEVFPQK